MAKRMSHAGDGAPIGRRVFLGLVAAGTAVVVAGDPLSRALSRLQATLATHDPTGLSALIPGGGWRYYTVTNGFPGVARADYRLQIGGLVARPLTLTLDDLVARPRTHLVRDFQCVTGWRVPDVHWAGVTLATLLQEAGVACLSGTAFGEYGEGFIRFSYANSLDNLHLALQRIESLLGSREPVARL